MRDDVASKGEQEEFPKREENVIIIKRFVIIDPYFLFLVMEKKRLDSFLMRNERQSESEKRL